ncbi:hypothetical protein E2320_013879, partial [Naja naja]
HPPHGKQNLPPASGRVHGRGRASKQAPGVGAGRNFKRLRVAMATVTHGISMATGWNRTGAVGRACWATGAATLLANRGVTQRAFASGAAAMAALKGKKGILFGVPGAFTPGCSKVRMLADPTGAFGKVLHGGAGQLRAVPQRGRGRHRADLQPGQQHHLPAVRPNRLCC